MADNLKLLLSILLDQAAQKDVERGLDSMARKIEGLDDEQLDDLRHEFESIIATAEGINEKFRAVRAEIQQLNRTASSIGQVGTGLAALGASVIGAYTLSAKQYVDFVEKAGIKNDELANRWIAANQRIKNAQLNIGQATATAVLPYLEKAAELVERVAAIVQQNPEAVKAVLGAGAAASIMGALALAVSKGIKIYADFKYIAATTEFTLATANFQKSVHEFLAGSVLPGKAGGAGGLLGGAGGIGKTAGTVGVYALATVVGSLIGKELGNYLGKQVYGEDYQKQGFKEAGLTFTRLGALPIATLAAQLEKVGGKAGELGDRLGDHLTTFDQWVQGLLGMKDSTDEATDSLRDYQAEAEAAARATARAESAMKASQVMQDLARQNADAEARFARDRAQIYASAGQSYRSATSQLSRNLSKIDQDLNSTLSKLATDFAKQNVKAEQDFQEQRQKTLQEANERIREIREQAQEQLENLEQDHADRLYDLGIARDALGIIQENRRYNREKAEIHKQTQEQISETRRQTQIQLAEQRRAFVQQQMERRQEYLEQAAEAKAEAEARRKQAQAEHQQQMNEIGMQTTERIMELRRAFVEEQKQRTQAAYQQLQLIFQSLQSERKLRADYYTAILADARAFMDAYQRTLRSSTGSTSTTTTTGTVRVPLRQFGGYGPGLVERGDEFVLNPKTTRVLESLVGARLNQNNVLAAIRGNVTLNDQRRFYGGISPAEKRMIDESTREQVAYLIGG